MFLEMADGVDDATWDWHRLRGDFSQWVETSIKDHELTAELRRVERSVLVAGEARRHVRDAIERRYTSPA
jgi:hypothetical protein